MFSLDDGYKGKLLKFLVAGADNTMVTYSLYVVFIYAGLHYNLALQNSDFQVT